MGGRGAHGKIVPVIPSIFDAKATVRQIETQYRGNNSGIMRGWYKDEVLEAVSADNDGGLKFVYATPTSRKKLAKTNKTTYLTYELAHGAVNGDVFGINWDNVKSVSGQTYNLRSELKSRGFKWDNGSKTWVKSYIIIEVN